ncbi:HK97 gp10 family phage protein [Clostridioides difficile]|uniref:HK97 gp10 family phage protein n=1 Tax=Bacillota TaxID=1239 RepID=UPI0006CFD2ED|nr:MULTISPECIES: HK97 gp10 family phage protein [Bacillota]MCD3416493.1 HK97 gp10 family phage protein [Streptococcus equi subsp. zooepidemicus]UUV09543.1 HK97 gp10 family phage protein [Clostridioides difficile]HCU2976139.1 HK97 gp10 family phage protein [Clostridioides difficile]HCU3024536.1 HK97 gp10 family phage protein [Clostridioides difficile]HCU3028407.1 HK97 gp10 family phage protein [Clostridioides difficile]
MANVTVDNLAEEIMKGLTEYKNLATADMKTAVRKAGRSVKKDIQANAPKKTGAYSKSWTVKTTKETSESLELTVHSPKKYQLAHLLEKGHAKRGGGRTKAIPHIAPAEEKAAKDLEADIKRALGGS